jgi:hypothetical protein
MCDWFRFYVDQETKVITIDIDTKTLVEKQPTTQEEADALCTEVIFPIVDELRLMCMEKGYSQFCTVDLKDLDITLLYPFSLIRVIWNIYEHNKADPEFLVKGFHIKNANKLFRVLYTGCQSLLPEYMTGLITIS